MFDCKNARDGVFSMCVVCFYVHVACVQLHVCVSVSVCMCMIIISPYRLRHWLRLNDDKRLYYHMQGSVGQLNLQLSVSKSTLHRKHGESYFIRWRSFKGASCNILITFIHSYSRGVPMRNIAAGLNPASIRMGRKQLPRLIKHYVCYKPAKR